MKKLNNRGFSLVELLVAFTVLAIVIVPLLHTFLASANTTARSRELGNATLAGKNLAENVEAHTVTEILNNPAGTLGAQLEGYHTLGGDTYDATAHSQKLYLSKVMGGGTAFQAMITLDAGGSKYGEENGKLLSQYGSMDAVFAQSRSEADDPDAIVRNRFLDEINGQHTDWNREGYSVTRTVTLEVSQGDDNKLNAYLTFAYVFQYTYYEQELQSDGTVLTVPYQDVYTDRQYYSMFPNGYALGNGSAPRYPNIYLMYYPLYGENPDNINVINSQNIPFTLFLVKQKEPGKEDNWFASREMNYESTIVQYQDEKTGVEIQEPAALIYSNAKESLVGELYSMNIKYRLDIGDYLTRQVQFAGEEGESLVGKITKDRLYEVTVKIFMPYDNMETAQPLYSFTTTKLQ